MCEERGGGGDPVRPNVRVDKMHACHESENEERDQENIVQSNWGSRMMQFTQQQKHCSSPSSQRDETHNHNRRRKEKDTSKSNTRHDTEGLEVEDPIPPPPIADAARGCVVLGVVINSVRLVPLPVVPTVVVKTVEADDAVAAESGEDPPGGWVGLATTTGLAPGAARVCAAAGTATEVEGRWVSGRLHTQVDGGDTMVRSISIE
jgi:hypothetical protein